MPVLLKLGLSASSRDLVYQFDVDPFTVSQISLIWLTLMVVRLKPLIMWPERVIVRRTIPECFEALLH